MRLNKAAQKRVNKAMQLSSLPRNTAYKGLQGVTKGIKASFVRG